MTGTSRPLILSLIVLAVFAACGEGSGPVANSGPPVVQSGPTPSPLVITPPSGSIFLGVYVNPSNVPSPPPSLLDGFQTEVGRAFALSPHYYGFYSSFPGAAELDDIANGRIPFESWDCQPSDAAIASGADDTYIRNLADTVRAFGYPIFIRYFWEMNLPASPTFHALCYDSSTDLPNGYFSPQYYVLAWKRIRALFAQEGVSNVVWVWNPSGSSNPSPYYPGGSEVDWIGFDLYDVANDPFGSVYTKAYGWLTPYGKPIIVGETGATQPYQPTYFNGPPTAASELQSEFPLIRAFIYFDGINERFGAKYSWAISNTTLNDFIQFAESPYVGAMPTISPIP